MDFPKRPSRNETEEDLLKLQDDFIKNNLKPNVTVVKSQRPENAPSSGIKNTTDSPQSSISSSKLNAEKLAEDGGGSGDTAAQKSKKNVSWLGEKASAKAAAIGNIVSSSDFSSLKVEKSQNLTRTQRRPKSLFALRMEQSRLKATKETASGKLLDTGVSQSTGNRTKPNEAASESSTESLPAQRTVDPEGFGDRSYILSGPESSKIHQENVERLSSMSLEEIKLERERLMSQLSPSTLSFLACRRKKNESKQNFNAPQDRMESGGLSQNQAKPRSKQHTKFFGESVARTITAESTKNDAAVDTDELSGLPIDPNEAKQWLHMNVIEKEKLQWMKDIPPVVKTPGPDEPYAARFDFEGNLMPYIDPSVEVNQGLHNHGDEPARPGYTLQELLQFTRSAVQQQRILGLTSIGNILTKTKLARYDRVMEQKLLRQLLDAGIFLLLRYSMDDPVASVATAATTAMSCLLFNPADEACLDYVLGCEGGLVQPTLQIVNQSRSKEDEEEEEELKDYELIQIDVMKGALRTNLVLRLGYLLDVVRITPGPVLDLLTVLSRHSPETVGAVVGCSGLLPTIRQNLLGTRISESPNPGYGEPSPKALRLFRVLVCRSRSFATTAVEKFNIMDSIMAYVSMSTSLPSSNLQGLVIGAFYLWQSLLSYGLCVGELSELHPILMRQLHYHAQLTSVVGEDATAPGHELVTALAGVLEKALLLPDVDVPSVAGLTSLLVDCTQKWLTQMTIASHSVKSYSWSGVKMLGAVFRCLAVAFDRFWDDDLHETQQLRTHFGNLKVNFLLPFIRSNALNTLTKNLKRSSHLLSKSESGSKRDAANLPSLASIDWGEEVLPAGLRDYSPIPLIGGLTQLVAVMHIRSNDTSEECSKCLLADAKLNAYLHDIASLPLRKAAHWFARQELYMLYHFISLANAANDLVPYELENIFGRLVLVVCGLIQNEDRCLLPGLFEHCIFDETSLVWRNKSSISSEHYETIHRIYKRFPLISNVYLHVLGLRSCAPPNPLTRNGLTAPPQAVEAALPTDWSFAPIMLLYGRSTTQDDGSSFSSGSEDVVMASLEFLFLSELHWSNPWPALSATAFWCRLSLIFLCGSDFFLSSSVQQLLKANQRLLLGRHQNIDFKDDIPGLSSFYEFYQELLLQFSAVSYGDNLFGAFVIFPLQQRYDVQLRRLLWTEHATALRFLRTTEAEVGVPIEGFLQPVESDVSILAAYLQYLTSAYVQNAFLAKIASNHIRMYVRQREDGNFAQNLYDSVLKINNEVLRHSLLS